MGQDALYCIPVQECWAGTGCSILYTCPGVFGWDRMLYTAYLSRSVWLGQDALLSTCLGVLGWDRFLSVPVQECWAETGYSITCPGVLGWDRILYLPVQWSWAGPVCSR